MKHLLSTALLCGIGILGAQAQNVVITDKDGIPHRFHADYVQEITFEKIQSGDVQNIKFESLNVNPYGKRNIGLTFTAGETTFALDIYQEEALYLRPGIYKVDPSYADYTIDPGYTKINLDGKAEVLTGGEMTVSENNGVYTFELNLTLESGITVKGTFTGELNIFGPVINFDLTGCSYATINDPAANGFYYKFNDTNWRLEMRIELYSAGEAPAAGVYKFGGSMEDGTAGSYVNLYSPYNETTEFTEGTVTISGEGDDTVVEIDGTLGFGMQMKARYQGKLPERQEN